MTQKSKEAGDSDSFVAISNDLEIDAVSVVVK